MPALPYLIISQLNLNTIIVLPYITFQFLIGKLLTHKPQCGIKIIFYLCQRVRDNCKSRLILESTMSELKTILVFTAIAVLGFIAKYGYDTYLAG